MNKKLKNEYEYFEAAKNMQFYMDPSALDTDPLYSGISDKAKRLYSNLLSRHKLSEKMGLKDQNGVIYVLFPQVDIAEYYKITERQVSNLLKQLSEVGLIKQKKVGYGNYDQICLFGRF